jgi:hypothetical protein
MATIGWFYELFSFEDEPGRRFRIRWQFEKSKGKFGTKLQLLDFHVIEIDPFLSRSPPTAKP